MVRESRGEFGFIGWLLRLLITAGLSYIIAGFITATLFALLGITIDLGLLLFQPAELLKTAQATAYAAVALMLVSWFLSMLIIYKLFWSGRVMR